MGCEKLLLPLDLDAAPSLSAQGQSPCFLGPTWFCSFVLGHVTWWNGIGERDEFVIEPTLSLSRAHIGYMNQEPFSLVT